MYTAHERGMSSLARCIPTKPDGQLGGYVTTKRLRGNWVLALYQHGGSCHPI